MDTNTLNVIDPEADDCCCEHLNRMLLERSDLEGPWECPECWSQWRMTLRDGMRHWKPVVECAMIRP